jgi:Leucine-rich repeat (LRR) protein
MYPVPSKLEYLNLSYNKMKSLNPDATKSLKNMRSLDISGNQLETLEGIQNMENLKILIAKNN